MDNGLEAYYQQRTEKGGTGTTLANNAIEALSLFDEAEVQKSFVRNKDNLREAALILEGIHCAACIWLNEKHLQQLEGVASAHINYSTHRASVTWDDSKIHLSRILNEIQSIGYRAHPYDPGRQQQLLEKEKRDYLKRLGLAGVLGMQVMVLAVAMYLGDWSGMDLQFRKFFTWLSLLLTLPIMIYSARPFFNGAFRDVRRFHAGMDVPVSVGLLLAFFGSAWNTWIGNGHVYYESVSMFVFFLLSARYLEMQARKYSAETTEALVQGFPAMARKIIDADGNETWIAAASLVAGDRIRVRPGETFATDGHLLDTGTSVDESLITGEHEAVLKQAGDPILGGSINSGDPAVMRISHALDDSVLSSIQRLVEQAQLGKPRISQIADRAAGWFVGTVLLLASAVAFYWITAGSSQWLAITISVLVVTCPCALSLATPTALTAATGAISRMGMVPTGSRAFEALASIDVMLFDKTGTLTKGKPEVADTLCHADFSKQQVWQLARSLEKDSAHPIALAFDQFGDDTVQTADKVQHTVGGGICGDFNGQRFCIGHIEFLHRQFGQKYSLDMKAEKQDASYSKVYLANSRELLATFLLRDGCRSGADATIRGLVTRNIDCGIISGDQPDSVMYVANDLGIRQFESALSPEQKLQLIEQRQADGKRVAMVGDGINDAPVLATAEVSIAMGGGTQMAASKADFILMNNQLPTIVSAVDLSRKTMTIIKQNLGWAVFYNLAALPLAAAGLVPPWLAAIGMSGSSLLVVLNALRLTRYK